MIKNFCIDSVFEIIKNIPAGKGTTYGAIGKTLNISPRLVGRILHQNPDPDKYPCHRVVRSDGTIAAGYAFGGKNEQIKKLISEGIEITNDRVCNMQNFVWPLDY